MMHVSALVLYIVWQAGITNTRTIERKTYPLLHGNLPIHTHYFGQGSKSILLLQIIGFCPIFELGLHYSLDGAIFTTE